MDLDNAGHPTHTVIVVGWDHETLLVAQHSPDEEMPLYYYWWVDPNATYYYYHVKDY